MRVVIYAKKYIKGNVSMRHCTEKAAHVRPPQNESCIYLKNYTLLPAWCGSLIVKTR